MQIVLKAPPKTSDAQHQWLYWHSGSKYTLCSKNWTTKLMVVTLSNPNRFSKFIHR